MALSFHPNIRNLYMGRGVAAVFSNPFAISIYSGVQPIAAQITSSWTLFNEPTSNFLAHYVGASWSQPSNGILLQLGLPPAVSPLKSGTASWAILWASNVSAVQTQGSTLPNASFMVVPCSHSIGQGVIRFTNPTLTAGVSTPILDGSMGAYMI